MIKNPLNCNYNITKNLESISYKKRMESLAKRSKKKRKIRKIHTSYHIFQNCHLGNEIQNLQKRRRKY
jgi:hypothetical protein